jgi:hypothetical protein
MLMLASSSSSPRHRCSIERSVDGGGQRVIGGRAGEMCGDRLQEMIALSDRQRRRRALQQCELLVREREGSRCGHVVFRLAADVRKPARNECPANCLGSSRSRPACSFTMPDTL